MKVLLLSLAMFSIATAVVAADPEPVSPEPTAVPAPTPEPTVRRDPNERVCKTTPVIGTKIPSRICRTRAEWEARTRADRADLEATQRSGLATCGTKPCS